MVINKRKKFSRLRATHTHGYGSKKKHRGAGSRGGRGMAGTGKRGDVKKPVIWKNKKYFGKHGFVSKSTKKEVVAINICDLETRLDNLLEKKLISKENDTYIVDLKKLGYNKLLGKGKVNTKFKIDVECASSKAIEKVKQAGGEVVVKSKGVASE
jgi:large subunit ribosomal protein L15